MGEKSMERFCIFCGNKPTDKTNEHVIPRWLMELTGDPKRDVFLGFSLGPEVRERRYSFDAFKFPACNTCNQNFSTLEAKVKHIIDKIRWTKSLTAEEINLLLNWFDKVRVGLWLAYYFLNKNIKGIQPKFFINQRVASFDRILCIYKVDDWISQGINFIGADTLCFQGMPSCFSLRINDFYFFNVSKEFLISKGAGFPYSTKKTFLVNGALEYKLNRGTGRIKLPLLKKPIFSGGFEIYQPIFTDKLLQPYSVDIGEMFESEYAKSYSIDYDNGLGPIIIKKGNNIQVLKDLKDETVIIPDAFNSNDILNRRIVETTYNYQIHLIEQAIYSTDFSLVDSDVKRRILKEMEAEILYNKKMLRFTKQYSLM